MLAIGTRFWGAECAPPERLISFIKNHLPLCDILIVALNAQADKTHAHEWVRHLYGDRVRVITVEQWGTSAAMNALLREAQRCGADELLSLSAEIRVGAETIQNLRTHLTDDTICVGVRLQGHDFAAGQQVATANNIPWNTCRLHRVSVYARHGYTPSADALGMEEFLTDARIQRCEGPQLGKIKLIEAIGVDWHIPAGARRRLMHAVKMRSKQLRVIAQQLRLNPFPLFMSYTVTHYTTRSPSAC